MNTRGVTFWKLYFGLLIVLNITNFIGYPWDVSAKDAVNHLLTLAGFVVLFGYAFQRKIGEKFPWKIFAIIFLAWEFGCYTFLYQNSIFTNLFILFTLVPKYWAVVCYAFDVMETDSRKRDVFLSARAALEEKALPFFRFIFYAFNILLVAFLVLSFFAYFSMGGPVREFAGVLVFLVPPVVLFFLRKRFGLGKTWQFQYLWLIGIFLVAAMAMESGGAYRIN